jgi:phosphoenolpyruvate-protein phosphotransferase
MLNERADDIEDLYRRMIGVLVGVEMHRLENLPNNTILVARRLLPSDTVFLSRESCTGILLEIAGPTAHSTILARELGVPCVGQVRNLISCIHTGNEILVDGNAGKITVNPGREAIRAFYNAKIRFSKRIATAQKSRFNKACTICGKTIRVMANVGSREDVERAAESGADGIGLFRTESFFLAAKTLPTADEFSQHLLGCLEPIGNKIVNLRLLDIGGDKNIPYLSLPFELNPFLGRRGVRLLFDFPVLLRIQLEAMLYVSQKYNIRILIPMVTFTEEIIRIRQVLEKIAKKKHIKPPPVGAMIETPAAALAAYSLRKQSDFLCIGTNDLTQNVMAADRESGLVSEYFKDDHSIILDLLRAIVAHAGKSPTTLCGELAIKRDALEHVLKTGINALSIAPMNIPPIKEAIRHLQISS